MSRSVRRRLALVGTAACLALACVAPVHAQDVKSAAPVQEVKPAPAEVVKPTPAPPKEAAKPAPVEAAKPAVPTEAAKPEPAAPKEAAKPEPPAPKEAAKPAPVAPADVCAGAGAAVAKARGAHDMGALDAAYADAEKAKCADKALFCLGRGVALGYLDEVYRRADAGAKAADALPLLTKARTFGGPWQVLAALGQTQAGEARRLHDPAAYSRAALTLQEALIAATDPAACGIANPPAPVLDDLYRRMTTALILARPANFLTTRCEACRWMFPSGFEPTTRPLPLTFDTAATEPLDGGKAAVEALVGCLNTHKVTAVVLSGHADPTGPAGFNQALSQSRLEKVRALILAGGYKGTVTIEPKGMSEPYAVPANEDYTKDELARLNRRIELRRATPVVAGACAS